MIQLQQPKTLPNLHRRGSGWSDLRKRRKTIYDRLLRKSCTSSPDAHIPFSDYSPALEHFGHVSCIFANITNAKLAQSKIQPAAPISGTCAQDEDRGHGASPAYGEYRRQ